MLDPVHVPINYNQAHYRKMHNGERLLRMLMNKFNKIDVLRLGDYWGPIYTGDGAQAFPVKSVTGAA